ncbi:hypothetical protein EI94DRAFT_1743281 [Lactarius quietus]|nr:hypothetical protein EI94DRAFT_1743281 [Lactarius quietus]
MRIDAMNPAAPTNSQHKAHRLRGGGAGRVCILFCTPHSFPPLPQRPSTPLIPHCCASPSCCRRFALTHPFHHHPVVLNQTER